MRWTGRGLVLALTLLVTYGGCVNHNEAYQVGIAWNFASGELSLQQGGFHVSPPWVLVARVDTRPQRVCITSRSTAAFNCKLIRFKQDEWRLFVATEGWRYYWLSNRISLNLGYAEEYRGFRDILRGYAFSAKQYPFVEVLANYEEAP